MSNLGVGVVSVLFGSGFSLSRVAAVDDVQRIVSLRRFGVRSSVESGLGVVVVVVVVVGVVSMISESFEFACTATLKLERRISNTFK